MSPLTQAILELVASWGDDNQPSLLSWTTTSVYGLASELRNVTGYRLDQSPDPAMILGREIPSLRDAGIQLRIREGQYVDLRAC